MRFDSRVFCLAKDPDQPAGCQDAAFMDPQRGLAAIADGVSSALFSGPWAGTLVQAVVDQPPDPAHPEALNQWLQPLRAEWAASIDPNSLAWHQRAKLAAGAFSTLLWVDIRDFDHATPGAFGGYRLLCHAIGDSCLFHIRGGELVRVFPLQTSAEFQADPLVLGSIDLSRDHLMQFASLDETCYPDDQVILCTDAVAEWAVRSYENGDPPVWDDFWKMSDDDWRAGILWLRHERQMRVDDTTMLLLRVVEQHAPTEHAPATETPAAEESSLDWIRDASKDVKSVTSQMSDTMDQAQDRMTQGIKSLTDKLRDKFGKKKK